VVSLDQYPRIPRADAELLEPYRHALRDRGVGIDFVYMTLELSTRPFTPEEAAHLASWRPPRFGISIVAAWLLIVPVVVAGIIGFTMVLAGVSLGMTLAMSYAIGLAFGVFAVARQRVVFRHSIDRYVATHKRARDKGTMSTIRFTASRVWDVEGLGDSGPGYLFDTETDHCVYLSGPELPELEQAVFPAREITVDVIPEIDEIHALRLGPGETTIEGSMALDRLNIDASVEAQLIPRAAALAVLEPPTAEDKPAHTRG
jgi:hypothetical protein